MIQKNIKANQKDRGFTIVELLVVIVVIGILAAITIVSYTGITTRANTTANKQNASSVLSSAQSYFADNNAYPTTLTVAAFNTNNSAKLPAGITMVATTLAAGTSIQYLLNTGSDGICVGYWDYATSTATPGTAGVVYSFSGTAGAATNGATPTCT